VSGHEKGRDKPEIRASAHFHWPEALALTLVILFLVLAASGWVDPMLPWNQ